MYAPHDSDTMPSPSKTPKHTGWKDYASNVNPDGDADDDGDGEFACFVCDHRTDIETPQYRTRHFCRGECDNWRTFHRLEHE